MTPVEAALADWLQIVRAEFVEIPGLHLTKRQVQRLWGLDAPTCDALLDALIAANFLKRTHNDGYIRADLGR